MSDTCWLPRRQKGASRGPKAFGFAINVLVQRAWDMTGRPSEMDVMEDWQAVAIDGTDARFPGKFHRLATYRGGKWQTTDHWHQGMEVMAIVGFVKVSRDVVADEFYQDELF